MRGVRTEAIVREAKSVWVISPLGGNWGGGGERKVLVGAYFIPSS